MKKKEISIVDMGTCNRFLDCFAPSFTKLKIEYSKSENELKHRAQLDRIVNKYCADYVTNITFMFAPKDTMMKMKKPFSKVESVEFIGCYLTGKLADFNYCFPNMKKLEIICDLAKIDGKCIARHFPNLEHLGFSIKGKSEHSDIVEGYIEKKHAAEAIQLNPQLRSLKIGYRWNTKFLKEISKYLQNIESLHFDEFIDNLDSGTIHFKSVKKLFLSCFDVIKIPFSFDQLEELSLVRILNKALNREEVTDFFIKHPTIKTLNIEPSFCFGPYGICMDQTTALKLAKGLPLLTDINLNRFTMSCDYVISFLAECKSLKKFEFQITSVEEFKLLQYCLSAEFNLIMKSSFFSGSVTMERKIDQNVQTSEKQS